MKGYVNIRVARNETVEIVPGTGSQGMSSHHIQGEVPRAFLDQGCLLKKLVDLALESGTV